MTHPIHTTSSKRILWISVITLLIALSIRTFVFQLYTIPTSSMAPTLIIGDYMVVSKYAYGYGSVGTFGFLSIAGRFGGHPPQRGDIIVFINPVDGIRYIKRLVGLPGDRIQMLRSELYINDAPVRRERLDTPLAFPGDDEPSDDIVDYIEYLPDHPPHIVRLIRQLEDEETVNNTSEMTVPPHQYFFMGDNRDNSSDSRLSTVGFVPEENLVGKAEFLFFSLDKNASFWNVADWPWAVRRQRLFMTIN